MTESYERYGTMRVIRRGGQVLVRSRYTLGALRSIWMAVGVLLLGVYTALRGLVRGRWAWQDPTEGFLFFFLFAIAVLLWGLGYFYRRDELLVSGDDWLFTSWKPLHLTSRRGFRREEVVGLHIDQSGDRYGLRLELSEGSVLLYSDANLSIVRGAGEFLKPILSLPVTDQIGNPPAN